MSSSDRDADTVVTRVPPSGSSQPSSRRGHPVAARPLHHPPHARQRRRAPGQFQHAALSPDGNWIVYQLGANGQSLWRLRLDDASAKPEKVREYAAGQTVGLPAIDNTGRVLATPATWSGDLFVIRPKPGHRF